MPKTPHRHHWVLKSTLEKELPSNFSVFFFLAVSFCRYTDKIILFSTSADFIHYSLFQEFHTALHNLCRKYLSLIVRFNNSRQLKPRWSLVCNGTKAFMHWHLGIKSFPMFNPTDYRHTMAKSLIKRWSEAESFTYKSKSWLQPLEKSYICHKFCDNSIPFESYIRILSTAHI